MPPILKGNELISGMMVERSMKRHVRKFLWLALGILVGIHPPAVSAGTNDSLSITWQLADQNVLLVPGKDVKVQFTVHDGDGQGVGGLAFSLAASAGKLTDIEDVGQGVYQARYRMPKSKHPQVVVLAAKTGGQPPTWTALHLYAKTELPVDTDKPNVNVTLRLGTRSYGPIRTDTRGKVRISVEIYPGETAARAVAVDEFGNRTIRQVSIPIPPYSRMVGFAERTTLAADGGDGTDLFIIQINPDGSPSSHTEFKIFLKIGSLSKPILLREGLSKLRYTAPKRLRHRASEIIIADQRDLVHNRQTFHFQFSAGKPQRLEVSAHPPSLFADGASTSMIRILVTDRAGNPLAQHSPSIKCDTGSIAPVANLGGGKFQSQYTSPSGAKTPAACFAELTFAGGQPLRQQIRLTLKSALPALLEIEANDYQLIGDGSSQANIALTIKDRNNNPIEGVLVRAQTAVGTLSPVIDDGQGKYHAVFTAPTILESTKIRIKFEAGSQKKPRSAYVVIEVNPPPPPPRIIPWVSVGTWAGLMTNFGRLYSPSFTVDSTMKLPFGKDRFYLALEGGYRFGEQESATSLADIKANTRLEVIPVHLSLVFKFSPQSSFCPFVGIGGGAEFVQWSIESDSGSRERNHQVLLGALASVGGELRLGPGAVFFTARYLYAYLYARSSLDPLGSLVKGNVGGYDFGLGYRVFY